MTLAIALNLSPKRLRQNPAIIREAISAGLQHIRENGRFAGIEGDRAPRNARHYDHKAWGSTITFNVYFPPSLWWAIEAEHQRKGGSMNATIRRLATIGCEVLRPGELDEAQRAIEAD